MLVELHTGTPIEVVTITATDYAIAFGISILLILLAVALTALVLSPEQSEPTPAPAVVDAPEAVKTVELPPRRPGLRAVPTIHAPQYQRPAPDEDTVFIELPGARY